MTDCVSPAKRSDMMRAVKSAWTGPEVSVQRLLRRLGCRPKTHAANLPGRPDFVFPRKRKIILVHGCFWHRHGCKYTTTPKSRIAFWSDKFVQNVRRDRRNVRVLRRAGWNVLVIWQCNLRAEERLNNRLQKFLFHQENSTKTLVESRRSLSSVPC